MLHKFQNICITTVCSKKIAKTKELKDSKNNCITAKKVLMGVNYLPLLDKSMKTSKIFLTNMVDGEDLYTTDVVWLLVILNLSNIDTHCCLLMYTMSLLILES